MSLDAPQRLPAAAACRGISGEASRADVQRGWRRTRASAILAGAAHP